MAVLKGRWPRAIFYDSKGTLFDWPWTWRQGAAEIVKKYNLPMEGPDFSQLWAKYFEGFHRRAAAVHYTPVSELIQEALLTALKMQGVDGDPADVRFMLDLQDQVQLFPDTEEALQEQQDLGVQVWIYSDVERKYLDMYVSKFKTFKPDFVATSDQAGFHKPHPKTYQWVLRQTGFDIRDVLYCAGPTFDCMGAMALDMVTAQIFRQGMSRSTFTPGDVPADYEVDDLHGVTEIIKRNRFD